MQHPPIQPNLIHQKVRIPLLERAREAQIVRAHVFGYTGAYFALDVFVNGW